MRLCRAMLILSFALLAFAAVMVTLKWPVLAFLTLVGIAARKRKAMSSDAFGSAQWATAGELDGWIEEE